MRVLVVGGGISGLSTSLFIKSLLKDKVAVRVIEKMQTSAGTQRKYLGLWSPSLSALDSVGAYAPLRRHGQFVSSSGYRSASGDWLSRPTDLKEFVPSPPSSIQESAPSLMFVESAVLLSLLRDMSVQAGVEYSPGTTFDPSSLSLSSFDLVIGADGSSSSVLHHSCPPSTPPTPPSYRGYCVYQSFVPQSPYSGPAFQTWGPGKRFAVVPIENGGAAFFAAVTVPESDVTSPEVVGRTKGELAKMFEGFHQPVEELIRTCSESDLIFSVARSDSRRRFGPSPLFLPPGLRATLVGDASFLLDPILAQGAGVGVEDGFILARVLRRFGSFSDEAHAAFEKERSGRRDTLVRVSDLAQAMGHVDMDWGVRDIRDGCMRVVPEFLKTWCMDVAIRKSVDSSVFKN